MMCLVIYSLRRPGYREDIHLRTARVWLNYWDIPRLVEALYIVTRLVVSMASAKVSEQGTALRDEMGSSSREETVY